MPPINATTWSWDQRTDVPQQSNSIDCGVFSLLFALFSAIKRDFDFTQSDIPYFRRKIVQDLLSGLELFCLSPLLVSDVTTEVNLSLGLFLVRLR